MPKSASSRKTSKPVPRNLRPDSETYQPGRNNTEKVVVHRKAQAKYYSTNPEARERRRLQEAERRAEKKRLKRRWDPPKKVVDRDAPESAPAPQDGSPSSNHAAREPFDEESPIILDQTAVVKPDNGLPDSDKSREASPSPEEQAREMRRRRMEESLTQWHKNHHMAVNAVPTTTPTIDPPTENERLHRRTPTSQERIAVEALGRLGQKESSQCDKGARNPPRISPTSVVSERVRRAQEELSALNSFDRAFWTRGAILHQFTRVPTNQTSTAMQEWREIL
ncbi:hypothetical protein B0H14DRAFT_2568365 [Mycena olivaceomarginata]|nr:hypothetical protein B0H14DRAFT_2568365 [Mycena olivaceomarginata]